VQLAAQLVAGVAPNPPPPPKVRRQTLVNADGTSDSGLAALLAAKNAPSAAAAFVPDAPFAEAPAHQGEASHVEGPGHHHHHHGERGPRGAGPWVVPWLLRGGYSAADVLSLAGSLGDEWLRDRHAEEVSKRRNLGLFGVPALTISSGIRKDAVASSRRDFFPTP